MEQSCFFFLFLSSLAMKRGQFFFFTSRRISRQRGRQEEKECMALGCAWMDGLTDGRFTLCFSVAGKSSTEKISSHDDVYIFAKLYKVALIVKSSGNHDNALTHQEVLPCGWAGGWAGVRWGLKKRGKKIQIKQVESGGSKTTNKQLK